MDGARKLKVAVVMSLVVGALSFLVLQSLSENKVYAVTVAEFVASPGNYGSHGVRIEGILKPGSHTTAQTSAGALHRFNVYEKTDESVAIPVAFTGSIPDTFRDGSELLVEGKMGADGVFAASVVTPKCASKYTDEPYAAGEGGGRPPESYPEGAAPPAADANL